MDKNPFKYIEVKQPNDVKSDDAKSDDAKSDDANSIHLKATKSLLEAQVDMYKQKTADLVSDREMREKFAGKSFSFVLWWSAGLMIILLCHLCGHVKGFSDSVIITLITAATGNVLGVFIIVNRYLFSKNKTKEENIKEKEQDS